MHFNSPLAAFIHWETNTPSNLIFKQSVDGKIIEHTYAEAGQEIRRIANAIGQLDLPEKSKIAILSKNCPHWIMADMAITISGHITVPLYATLSGESLKSILEHSESAAIVIGKLDDYDSQKSGIPDIHKIGVRQYGVNEGQAWEDILEQNEPLQEVVERDSEDLLTIMYTSGTTGDPKGVMHSAGNFARSANTFIDALPVGLQPSFFSYLPLTHIAERIGIETFGLFRGASFTFPESLATFASDLAATQPDLFFAVPRIWSKFQEKILEKMPQKKLDTFLAIPILGGFVRKKIKKSLGLSRAVYIVAGAAPISANMLNWYEKLGITIHQGYAMTEDCILSHFNLVNNNRIGTVGRALPGVEKKLSPEGEICIKTSVLMQGYYKAPDQTAEMFDEDGFLKTGDIGEYDHDGYLTITGRVKDQFKTDKGKYISPAPIELDLSKNTDIELLCLVGMGIPQPIALVVPSELGLKKGNEKLAESLAKSVKELNPSLEKHEKIQKVVVMKEQWSVDNGLLTPTLKTKRNQIEKIHMPMYKAWFEDKGSVIFE